VPFEAWVGREPVARLVPPLDFFRPPPDRLPPLPPEDLLRAVP
jgi:hypothetical protein